MRIHIKLLTLLLALLMLLQASAVTIFAFEPIDVDSGIYQAATGYNKSSDVEYVKDGKYIANWGWRGEVCVFLSPNAISFYSGDDSYDVVSQLSGGKKGSESSAPSSNLYKELQSIMKSAHTTITSYDATKQFYKYTDCQNSKYSSSGAISSFYSGDGIGPNWGSSPSWNREHTWPNSKGDLAGQGENDIMMLRPTASSENGSRGNAAYGEGSSYYHPNSESNGKYDLRGDVARIVLYTYVRWGCTNTGSGYNPNGITGIKGVIESIAILLKWVEADPVDTWEMGRNDAVESITGTRNVFVDYPEYAFLLFGEEIPSDMVTPSGKAQTNGHHWDNGSVTTAATCTSTGVKTYTCTDSGCGATKTEAIAALGHSYGSETVTLKPTCTAAGTKSYSCSTCNKTVTESIKALGHSYGAWITDVEATETATGSKHRECATCGNTETTTIPMVGHNHDYSATVITLPTCTEQGYSTHYCSCGHSYVDSYVSKAAHDYVNGRCSVCGYLDPNSGIKYYSATDFINAVNSLSTSEATGEERYNDIRNVIVIYNSLDEEDKSVVSNKYNLLKDIVAQYNNSVNAVNEDANKASESFIGVAVISASAILFAVVGLLTKKYF